MELSRSSSGRAALFGFLAALILLLAPVSAPAATTVIRTLSAISGDPIPCAPSGVGANPVTNKIYVSMGGDGRVAVIDGNTNDVIPPLIALGGSLNDVAVNPVTNRIYVAQAGTPGNVLVIDGATDTLAATLAVGNNPRWIGVNTATDTAYVANETGNSVTIVNGLALGPTFAVGGNVGGVGVHTGNGRVYVGIANPVHRVEVYSAAGVFITMIGGINSPNAVVVDSAADRVYVSSETSSTLTIIETITHGIVSTVPVGANPYGVAVNPARNRAYTANGGGSTVSVVNTSAGVLEEPDVPIQGGPADMDYNPANQLLYAANSVSCSLSVLRDEGEICGPGSEHWWDSRWGRRRQLTLNNAAQIESFTDFPVLIKLNSSRIDYARTQDLGEDLRFVDSDDITLLDYEIERWDETGTSWVWVRVPSVLGTSYKTIYMYFDNSSAPDDQNPNAVWDGGFSMVQHLEENPPGTHVDSTSNGNDSSVIDVGTQGLATGQIDGADTFTSGSCPPGPVCQNVDVLDDASLNVGAAESLTVEAWIRTSFAGDQMVVDKEDAGGQYKLWTSGGLAVMWVNDGPNPTDRANTQGTTLIDNNQFHYLVGRFDRVSDTSTIFVDGVLEGTSPSQPTIGAIGSALPLVIGEEADADRGFNYNGIIDEVRVSKVLRSEDWIRAQHLSMTDRFVTYGPETGPCNLRSIGPRVDYGFAETEGAGSTIEANVGSRTIMGASTTWQTANRGRGDVIQIDGTDYVILAVNSQVQLTLVAPFRGTPGVGKPYRIARQFDSPQLWEDCIDGGLCPYFNVPSDSLVADNRGEIGVAYNDTGYPGFPFVGPLVIDGRPDNTNTDAVHTIRLTADTANRHNGISGAGVVLGNALSAAAAVQVRDNFVTVEWLEVSGGMGVASGVEIDGVDASNQVVIRNSLLHNVPGNGVHVLDADTIADIYNDFVYAVGGVGIAMSPNPFNAGSRMRILSNTVYGNVNRGVAANAASNPTVLLRNNISHSNAGDFQVPGSSSTSSHNLAGDGTAPGPNSLNVPLVTSLQFVNAGAGNLHILPGSAAENVGVNLGLLFDRDIDQVIRLNVWEMGADDTSQTTAVTLMAFGARGGPGPTGAPAVVLSWETASEVDNLGFHLYRSTSGSGPWERITGALIPGLGGSPTGRRYGFVDTVVQAGVRYFYELEDLETTGATNRHGPVSAVAGAGADGDGNGEDEGGASEGSLYGSPGEPTVRVLERGADFVVLELLTPGFRAVSAPNGRVRLEVAGFEATGDPTAPAVPVKGATLEALAGRRVRVASAVPGDLLGVPGLPVGLNGAPTVRVSTDGEVKAGRTNRRFDRGRPRNRALPRPWARIASVGFQGETKKARIELAPLRHDPQTGTTELARRLVVRVEFRGAQAGENPLGGSQGRRPRPEAPRRTGVVAQLVTKAAGLYGVRFEEVFGPAARGIRASGLRLSRQGEDVAFHVEPDGSTFGPGSRLFFVGGGELNPSGDAVYELARGERGTAMTAVTGALSGPPVTAYEATRGFEENHFYQAALLDAPDLWQWDVLIAPQTQARSFVATAVAASTRATRVKVVLQGASDFEADPDHHVRVFLNQTLVGEASWDGRREQVIEGGAPPGILREGANALVVESAGDTAAAASMVFLNRYEVSYPRRLEAEEGRLEGRFADTGMAEVPNLSGPGFVVDTTGPVGWLRDVQAGPGGLRFPAEGGRRYLAVAEASVLSPEVRPVASTGLGRGQRVDWLLVAPRAFLPAAQPLVDLRASQGLRTRAVALEDVNQDFGHGEAGPEGLKAFLEHAYQRWPRPSLRYVLLLGDSTYDPKDHLGTHVVDRVPFYPLRTTYLWTASDPAYASVNGEDLLPDVALGRLPARDEDEARALVEKLVAFESAGRTLGGRAVLVADNADAGGPFETHADEAATLLAPREVQKIYLRDLGPDTRARIVDALDAGPAVLSYVGHGGTVVWASENIFNHTDVDALSAQSQQPLLLTLNCLNGFFHFPPLDSLSEALLKAEGRGAIAAFSPSGLSQDGPAHVYHKALLVEIESGRHVRLGDALLAAQAAYADSGAMPELLAIYHLFGDPAQKIR